VFHSTLLRATHSLKSPNQFFSFNKYNGFFSFLAARTVSVSQKNCFARLRGSAAPSLPGLYAYSPESTSSGSCNNGTAS